jgi:hypothetical protein
VTRTRTDGRSNHGVRLRSIAPNFDGLNACARLRFLALAKGVVQVCNPCPYPHPPALSRFDCLPFPQAEGLIHTSPGQRSGWRCPKLDRGPTACLILMNRAFSARKGGGRLPPRALPWAGMSDADGVADTSTAVRLHLGYRFTSGTDASQERTHFPNSPCSYLPPKLG